MKIKVWHPGMSDKETADLAYWERNTLALLYAQGWYNDDILVDTTDDNGLIDGDEWKPRYPGWRRVLSLAGGTITFHVPDDFDVGDLKQIPMNWDGHTTEEKWRRIMRECSIEETTP